MNTGNKSSTNNYDDDDDEGGSSSSENGGGGLSSGDDNTNATLTAAGSSRPGFKGFSKGRTVNATLFKLNPIRSEDMAIVEEYIRGGTWMKDLRFALEVYNIVNGAGQRRDISWFWASPKMNEVMLDTNKRRKVETQQKALAVSSFIKANSTQDAEDANKYIENVNRLMDWEDKQNSRDILHTVSQGLQAAERTAVRAVMQHPITEQSLASSSSYGRQSSLGIAKGHLRRLCAGEPEGSVDSVCHTLRRSAGCFDVFARLVSSYMKFDEATGGGQHSSIYLNRTMSLRGEDHVLSLLRVMQTMTPQGLPKDTMGMPMKLMQDNICVRNDVLMVAADSTTATYVLSVEGQDGSSPLNMEGVDNIRITCTYSEDEYNAHQRKRRMQAPPSSLQQNGGRSGGDQNNQNNNMKKNRAPPSFVALMQSAKDKIAAATERRLKRSNAQPPSS